MIEALRTPAKPIHPENFDAEAERARSEYIGQPSMRGYLVGHYLDLAVQQSVDYGRIRQSKYPGWAPGDFWEMLRIFRAAEKEILKSKQEAFEKERDERWTGFAIPKPEYANCPEPFPNNFDVEKIRLRSTVRSYPNTLNGLVRYWNDMAYSGSEFPRKNFPKWKPEHFRAFCVLLWEEEGNLIESRLAEYQMEIDRRFGDLDLELCVKRRSSR